MFVAAFALVDVADGFIVELKLDQTKEKDTYVYLQCSRCVYNVVCIISTQLSELSQFIKPLTGNRQHSFVLHRVLEL